MHKLAVAVTFALATPFCLAAGGQAPSTNTPPGLAVGQDAKLLQTTRDANAGAGNGGEFQRVCNPKRAHRMCSMVENDPGNSQQHNESPECDIVQCAFDPNPEN